MDMGIEEEDPGDGHKPSDEIPFDDKPVESTPSASNHPAVPSPTASTLPARHPATSAPTTTLPMAEGLGFTGMPYSTSGVTPAATAPPMATTVSEPMASSCTYTGIHESMLSRYVDDYHSPAAAVYMTGIPGFTAPEPGSTMQAPGFTSLSGLRGGLRGPVSCGGRSRGSRRSSNKSLTRAEIREPLQGATADLVGDGTQEIPAKLEPVIPPQASPTAMGASAHRPQANHLVAGLPNTMRGLRSRPMPNPCCDTKKPFCTNNGRAPLQPRGELHASRAAPVGADSPKGYGRCGALWL